MTINSGISINPGSGDGIDASGSNGSGIIANNGTISVSGLDIGIANTGTLSEIDNNLGASILTAGAPAGGWDIENTGTITNIVNDGTMSASQFGMFNNNGTITGITNSGSISGGNNGAIVNFTGTISSINNNAGGSLSGSVDGMTNTGTIGSIINGGTISGTADGINTSGIIGSINNTGTISGGANLSVSPRAGIANQGGTITSISNSGLISGDIDGGIFNSAGTIGTLTNNVGGTIQGTGGPAINMTGLTTTMAIVLNGGNIIGDVTDDTPSGGFSTVTIGGDFATQGNFHVSSLKINSGKTLTISSGNNVSTYAMNNSSGGILQFGGSTTVNFGQLTVTNGAINLTGMTERILVGGGSTLAAGQQIELGTGNAAIVGGFGAVKTTISSNDPALRFQLADGTAATGAFNADDLFLFISPGTTPGSGQRGLYNILQGLSGTTDPVLSQVIANVNGASTNGALTNILSATTPTADGSDFTGSLNVSDNTLNLTGARLTDLRRGEDNSTGMAAGNMSKGLGVWGQAFGQHVNQGEREGIGGYHSNTWGGALGLDTRNVSDRAIVGLAFSYGRTNARSDNANTTDTNVDSYQVTLYGNLDLTQGMYLDGMAGYGWNSNDRTRHDVGGISGVDAHGSYNARQISAQAEAGKNIGFHGMTLTPNVLAHWVNFNPDSYTETGAGGADLHVNGNTLNLFELGGGVKAGWTFKNSDGSQIKPQLNIGYRYAVTDDQISDTGSFTGGGGAFVVTGPTPARSALDLGASVKFLTTSNWDFTASYDFDWRDNYTANAGFLRATYKF